MPCSMRYSRPAVAICALLAACAQTPALINSLPELPAEIARDLAPARTAPVLITQPLRLAPPVAPRPETPPALAPARACTAVYEGYVTYPITVCYPPTATLDAAMLAREAASSNPPPPGTIGVLPSRFFKLSSHPLVAAGFPWFCSMRSGPWFGHIEGRQLCNVDPNVRLFTAQILGAPEPVVVTWSGQLGDVPAPLQLPAVTQKSEFCTCCSGIGCPDGRCVANIDQCGVGPPALK
jgi:hypothetical protein